MVGAGAGVKNFWVVEPKQEPEIWVPVAQSLFVGQAFCTNNEMFFSFQWTQSFWIRSQKLLDNGAGPEAKNFGCLELELEI